MTSMCSSLSASSCRRATEDEMGQINRQSSSIDFAGVGPTVTTSWTSRQSGRPFGLGSGRVCFVFTVALAMSY